MLLIADKVTDAMRTDPSCTGRGDPKEEANVQSMGADSPNL